MLWLFLHFEISLYSITNSMGACMSSQNHRSLENINLPLAKPKDIITFNAKEDKVSALASIELNKDEVEICNDVHG